MNKKYINHIVSIILETYNELLSDGVNRSELSARMIDEDWVRKAIDEIVVNLSEANKNIIELYVYRALCKELKN